MPSLPKVAVLLVVGGVYFTSGVRAEPVHEKLVATYCLDCHDGDSAKGDVDLEALLEDPLASRTRDWEQVVRQMEARLMPPIEKERPSEAEYAEGTRAITRELDALAEKDPQPGRTDSLRRLTRTEYQNSIRDLLGIEIDARAFLPADQASHGFDNVTVGDLPPALLDRAVRAAEEISRIAVGRVGNSPDGRTVRIPPDTTQEGHVEGLPLGTRGGTLIRHTFLKSGEYEFRIRLARDRNESVEGLRGTHQLEVLLDGEKAAGFEVKPPKNRNDHTKVDAHLQKRVRVEAGFREVGVTFVAPPVSISPNLRQPYQSSFNYHRHPRLSPAIYEISITGPFDVAESEVKTHAPLLDRATSRDDAGARQILRPLIDLAYRGKSDESDLDRAMDFYASASEEGGFEAGVESALSAILVSPKFLFRVERDPEGLEEGAAYSVSGLDLASRLSFFLWSSLPDDELLKAARSGSLDTAEGLEAQTRRMIADPRSRSLVDNFASQWLYLRNLDSFTPDGRLFPDFDDNLRRAMRTETELLFESVLRNDQSVLDLLRSDHTYLTERLAKHYGIPHVYGERFRRVELEEGSRRGGILRHASLLTVTSYANRTSPVLRGHWIMKNLLGTSPPPPPPDIPSLDDAEVIDVTLPMRERLAVHREDRACAHCHNPMDPIGFAFENFDAVGQWRSREGETPIDSSGSLPDGTPFAGIDGLEAGLLERPHLLVGTLSEKLLVFALGRGIEPSDAPAVREIIRETEEDEHRFSDLLVQIVLSDPFRMRSR